MKIPTKSILAATYLGYFCYNPGKTWIYTVQSVAGLLFLSVVNSIIFPCEKSILNSFVKPEKKEMGTQTDEEFLFEEC